MALGVQQSGADRVSLAGGLETTSAARRPRRRLTLRRVVLSILLVLGFVVGALTYSVLRTPSWFAPPVIADEAARQRVRNNLVNAEQAFTQSLLAGRPFVYHVYQDDLNRWLAMRKEIYARVDELVPKIVDDPFIVIEPDRIMLAGRVKKSGADAVLSLELEMIFDHDAILLTAKTIRCGVVPIPIAAADLKLDFSVEADPGDIWPGSPLVSGSLIKGLRVGSRATWRNGGVPYRVTGLKAQSGRLDLHIEPEARQSSRRNHHWSDDDSD